MILIAFGKQLLCSAKEGAVPSLTREMSGFFGCIFMLPDSGKTRDRCGPMYPSKAYDLLKLELREHQGRVLTKAEVLAFDDHITPYLVKGQLDKKKFRYILDKDESWWALQPEVDLKAALMGALCPEKPIDLKMPVVLDCATLVGIAQLEFLRRQLGDERFGLLTKVRVARGLESTRPKREAVEVAIGEGYAMGLVAMFWQSVLPEEAAQATFEVGDVICMLGMPGYAKKQAGGHMAASTVIVVEGGSPKTAKVVGFGYPKPVLLRYVKRNLQLAFSKAKTPYQVALAGSLTRAGRKFDDSLESGEGVELGAISYWSRLSVKFLEWAKTVSLEPFEDPNGRRIANDASLLQIWGAISLLKQELKRVG